LAELSAFVGRALGSAPSPAVGKRDVPPPSALPPHAAAPRSEAESPAADYRMLLEGASHAASARQYDRAEQLYRMALVKNPGDTEALGGLGDVARARGNLGLARTYYEQVLAKNPQYLPSLNALADLDWESGDRASAVKRYSELIEISPSSPLATRARNRIAEAQSGREDSKRSSAEPPRSGVEPKSVPTASPAEKPAPPSSDLPPGVDTSDLPGFHR
jgi:tetratricopeptide (TPR) repeat protein